MELKKTSDGFPLLNHNYFRDKEISQMGTEESSTLLKAPKHKIDL